MLRFIAIGISVTTVHAQTWETVDDIDAPSANPREITTDSAGNIFVAGSIKDETTRHHAVVMKSGDGGATWETALDIPAPQDSPGSVNGSAGGFSAIASTQVVGGENHLVAAGRIKRVYNSSGSFSGQWLIVRSKDAGATWQTVDEYTHPTYSQISANTFPGAVGIDSLGNIYVSGSAQEQIVQKGKTTTINHWIVRKGSETAGGMSWTTVGDFAYTVTSDWDILTYPVTGIVCVGNTVFLVGGGGGAWQVRRSSNGGATWQLVDSYRLSASEISHAFGVAADSLGNVWVVGTANQTVKSGMGKSAATVKHQYWIVRRGDGTGTSWTTVDQFQLPNGGGHAYGVTVDGNDNVHVTGSGWLTASPSLGRWITRERSAATGQWSTTDDFTLAADRSAGGKGITADRFGGLFAIGSAADAGGVLHSWLVRRKFAP